MNDTVFFLAFMTYLDTVPQVNQFTAFLEEYSLTLLSPLDTARKSPDESQVLLKFPQDDKLSLNQNLLQFYPGSSVLSHEEAYTLATQWDDEIDAG